MIATIPFADAELTGLVTMFFCGIAAVFWLKTKVEDNHGTPYDEEDRE